MKTTLRLVGREPLGTDTRVVQEALKHYRIKHPKRDTRGYREELYDTVGEFEQMLNKKEHAAMYSALFDRDYDIIVRRHYAAKLFSAACAEKDYKIALNAVNFVKKRHRKDVGLDDGNVAYKLIANDIKRLLDAHPKETLEALGLTYYKNLRKLKRLLRG